MTSVLSYPSSDPFASSITVSSSRHSNSQTSDLYPSTKAAAHRIAQTASSPLPANMASDRSRGFSPPFASSGPVDEFGAARSPPSAATTSRPRTASGQSPNLMSLAPAEPIASTSTTHASSHTHTAIPIQASASTTAQRQRNRQSHNPSATVANAAPSPYRPEVLSDEYVLHPSVYAYKQAHPRRPMVAFGPYVLLQTLGEGEFGKVKLGIHTEYGVQTAIKLIRRGSLDDQVRASKVEREIDVLKTLRHPNIVRMFDVIDTDKYIGIVLEMAGGGELFDHILASRYLKERDAQRLFAQLVSGVDYLHKKHIIHRDLKLENLLLDKNRNIIITDFGFANRFDHSADDLMATSCGSPCYAAPELVVSEGLYVGSAVDIWSCGVILFAMLSGYLPYDDDPSNPDGDNINLLYRYIMNTRLNFPSHMSTHAQSLLQIMLVPDPQLRCTITAIMQHPWLSAYTELFARSPTDHEFIFQETMYHKSQLAKRELAERRRVQEEAKAFKAMQRSQSSAPGASVTANMLDNSRRREQRHQSAMPTLSGTTTMPINLNNGGSRTPPLSASYTAPIGGAFPSVIPAYSAPLPTIAPLSAPLAEIPPFAVPAPTVQPIAAVEAEETPEPTVVDEASETPTRSTEAVEDESIETHQAVVERPVTPPAQSEAEKKEPMSANKNRHTIQVEYDMEASYERMQETMGDRGSPQPTSGAPEASSMDLQPVTSDIEMDSGSEQDHRTEESLMERISPEASHATTPPLAIATIPEVESAVPTTPKKAKASDPTSPTTPRASATVVENEDAVLTPRQKKVAEVDATPRPRAEPVAGKRRESMPPTALLNAASSGLNSSGLPAPPSAKRERSRKGMSLDKFGLARLLGQVRATEDKSVPPSSFAQNADRAKRGSMSRPSTSAGEPKTDKKAKRRTIQIGSERSESSSTSGNGRPSTSAGMASRTAPLSPRDMNPPFGVKAGPAPPAVSGTQVHHPHGQSSPSVVTVDALTAQQAADAKENKHISSGAAKKVMDWFRRKTLAKDTLANIKTTQLRSDSTTSFVRISDGPAQGGAPHVARENEANVAMSSTSSFARTAENTPLVAVTELPQTPSEAVQPPADVNSSKTDDKNDKAPAASSSNQLMLPPGAGSATTKPTAPRSMSHNPVPVPATAPLPSTATLGAPKSSTRPSSSNRSDEAKMRVHDGFVDQSALSSKPPKVVMDEVLRVLQDMGMDVKKENEFRFRCTRVRKRKAGATTGLGLGSVMSVGSMGSFSLMGNASTSRVDSRGLPMPQSPSMSGLSGGLKGMLLRRGSSYGSSTHLPRSESALSETNLNSPRMSSPPPPTKEPIYGEHSIDSGDEVKFYIELCKLKNLNNLYLLNIKRIRGNVWSFKFIYQTVIDRCETLTH